MYLVMVLGLMVVLPIASVLIELAVSGGSADPLTSIGRWFLFWGAGVRLFIAGISQTFRPQFTAQNILGEQTPVANQLVRELGFANLGFGIVAIAGAWVPGWMVPAAIAPGVFLLLAGITHIVKRGKNAKELIATLTDLLVGVALLGFVVLSLLGTR
jgi:hypothetical protein